MQTSIETTLLQHLRNIAMLLQKYARLLQITSKVLRCHNGSRHDFCITHLPLWVFIMMKSLQHIIAKTINDYNLPVHGVASLLLSGVVTYNSSRYPMDFKLGSNLGYLKKKYQAPTAPTTHTPRSTIPNNASIHLLVASGSMFELTGIAVEYRGVDGVDIAGVFCTFFVWTGVFIIPSKKSGTPFRFASNAPMASSYFARMSGGSSSRLLYSVPFAMIFVEDVITFDVRPSNATGIP